jgi:hypothetical protein
MSSSIWFHLPPHIWTLKSWAVNLQNKIESRLSSSSAPAAADAVIRDNLWITMGDWPIISIWRVHNFFSLQLITTSVKMGAKKYPTSRCCLGAQWWGHVQREFITTHICWIDGVKFPDCICLETMVARREPPDLTIPVHGHDQHQTRCPAKLLEVISL